MCQAHPEQGVGGEPTIATGAPALDTHWAHDLLQRALHDLLVLPLVTWSPTSPHDLLQRALHGLLVLLLLVTAPPRAASSHLASSG